MVLPVLFYVWTALAYTVNMPYWDDYDSVLNWINQFITNHNNLKFIFYMLLRQHNEHRILFDRIIVLSDYYLFHSINFIYLNFIGYAGLLALFFIIILIGKNKGLSIYELIPLPFLLLSLAQYELISFAMASLQQYWEFLFSLSAIIAVTAPDKPSTNNFLACFLLAVAASFTSAGGLIVFPVVLIFLIYTKNTRHSIIWLASSSLVFILYFVILKYHPTGILISSHIYALEHPLLYLAYIFSFIGSMAGSTGLIFGILFFLISIIMMLKYHNKNLDILFITLFILSTSAAAGLSRMGLGIGQALSSRYTIYSSVYLALLYILIINQIKQKPARKTFFVIFFIFSAALYIYWIPEGLTNLNHKYAQLQHSLVYPNQKRAQEIINKSIDLKVFSNKTASKPH